MGSFPRSILACGYLFYRDIYLQIPFSSWDGEFKITCLFRNITSIPHLLYKANHHESLTLDPKAKSWLERNLDSRNAKPWGGGMLYCHLTHVPNTYLIEAVSVRAIAQAFRPIVHPSFCGEAAEEWGLWPSWAGQQPVNLLAKPGTSIPSCPIQGTCAIRVTQGSWPWARRGAPGGFRNPLKTS